MRTSLYILAAVLICVLFTQFALGAYYRSRKRKVPRSVRLLLGLSALIPLIFLAGLGGWHLWNSALSNRQNQTVEKNLNSQVASLKDTVNKLKTNPNLVATLKNPQITVAMQSLALENSLRTAIITDEKGVVIASPLQPELVGIPSPYASFLSSVDETISGISTASSQKNIVLLAFTPLKADSASGYLIVTKDIKPLSGGHYGALLVNPYQLVTSVNGYKLDAKGSSASLINSISLEPMVAENVYRVIDKAWYSARVHRLPVLTISQPLYLFIITPVVFPLYLAYGVGIIVVLLILYIIARRRLRARELPGIIYLLLCTLVFSAFCALIIRSGFYNRYALRVEKAQPILNASLGFYGSAISSKHDTPVTISVILNSPGAALGRVQGTFKIDPPGSANLSMVFDNDNCPIHAVKEYTNDSNPLSILCIPPRTPYKQQNVIIGSLTITPRSSEPFTVGFDPTHSLIYTTDFNQVFTTYPPVSLSNK